MKSKLTAEEQFLEKWNEYGFPNSDITREYKFHSVRGWRFDFAFPSRKVGIEIDGRASGSKFGGHQSVLGVRRDCQKANSAVKLGWVVLRIPTTDITAKNEWGEPLIELFIELVCQILDERDEYDTP